MTRWLCIRSLWESSTLTIKSTHNGLKQFLDKAGQTGEDGLKQHKIGLGTGQYGDRNEY
jgi:hypothetical protein